MCSSLCRLATSQLSILVRPLALIWMQIPTLRASSSWRWTLSSKKSQSLMRLTGSPSRRATSLRSPRMDQSQRQMWSPQLQGLPAPISQMQFVKSSTLCTMHRLGVSTPTKRLCMIWWSKITWIFVQGPLPLTYTKWSLVFGSCPSLSLSNQVSRAAQATIPTILCWLLRRELPPQLSQSQRKGISQWQQLRLVRVWPRDNSLQSLIESTFWMTFYWAALKRWPVPKLSRPIVSLLIWMRFKSSTNSWPSGNS